MYAHIQEGPLSTPYSMEHAKVSRANPAVVICAVDCSRSMVGSGALHHATAAISSLRRHARAKRRQVWLVVFGFSDTAERPVYEGWCEDVTVFSLRGGSQTHLKMACDEAVTAYDRHVKLRCKEEDPLANVLIFTDGGHSAGIDFNYTAYGGRSSNKWFDKSPNGWIAPIAGRPNVILGVIDYSGDLPEFPLPGANMRRSKVNCASVLGKSMLEKSYAREQSVPPPPGQSLREVFGPLRTLEGRLFIVSSRTIHRRPGVTSAFVRLGTASSFVGAGTGGGDGGPPVDDDTDFTAIHFGGEEE